VEKQQHGGTGRVKIMELYCAQDETARRGGEAGGGFVGSWGGKVSKAETAKQRHFCAAPSRPEQ